MSIKANKMLAALRNKYKKVLAQDDYRGFIAPRATRRVSTQVTSGSRPVGAAIRRIPKNPYGAGVSAGKKPKRVAAGRKGPSTNPWIKHVKAYWRAHPQLTYGEAMKKAKSTY